MCVDVVVRLINFMMEISKFSSVTVIFCKDSFIDYFVKLL